MSLSKPEGFPGLPDGWEYRWVSVPAADGSVSLFVSQFVRKTLPQSPRLLFVLHGQGEHGARYQHFPAFLESSVDGVICMDHRGHGRSQGVRGHVEHFSNYVDDAFQVLMSTVETFTDKITGKAPTLHLLGHSMGGLIALLLLQEKSVTFLKSATISAPLLQLNFEVPLIKKVLGQVMSKVLGGLQLDTGLDPHLISHDLAVVAAYRSDQLVHGKATARFFTEMLSASRRARERDTGIYVPLQLVVPLEDGIVSAQASVSFFEKLKHHEKRLVRYEGFFHESFNEVDKVRAFGDLRTWITAHS